MTSSEPDTSTSVADGTMSLTDAVLVEADLWASAV
jgi:hypothetical protein